MSDGKRFRERPPKFAASAACISLYKEVFSRSGKEVRIRSISGIPGTGSGSPLPAGTGRTWKTPSGSLKTPAALPWCTRTISSTLFSPLSTPAWASRTSTLERQTILAVDLGSTTGRYALPWTPSGISWAGLRPVLPGAECPGWLYPGHPPCPEKSGAGQEISAVYQRLDGLKWNYVRQLAHWVVQQARQRGAYGMSWNTWGK